MNLVATATAPNQITLTWTPAPTAASYRVYRAMGACPQTTYSLLASNVPGPTYVDNTVSGGITYAYVVTFVDSVGSESGFSNCDDALATGGCTLAPTFAGVSLGLERGDAGLRPERLLGRGHRGLPGRDGEVQRLSLDDAGLPAEPGQPASELRHRPHVPGHHGQQRDPVLLQGARGRQRDHRDRTVQQRERGHERRRAQRHALRGERHGDGRRGERQQLLEHRGRLGHATSGPS